MELTLKEALQKAVEAHKAGQIQEADRLYTAILQAQPKHPDANHNLGVIAVSVNKADAALPLLKTALEANPKVEQFWLSYIDALIKEKQFDNAKQVLEQAKNQGMAQEKLNILEAQLSPETQIQNVNSANPPQTQLSSLAEHYQNGRFSDAEKLSISITQEFPTHQLGWKVLSAVLKQTGRLSESLVAGQKSVQLAPQDAEAHNNLGSTLKLLGRLEEAAANLKQAIVLKPDYAEFHNNFGNTLKQLVRLEEAEASYRQAIVLKSNYADAHYNLGIVLEELGRLDEAEASYRQAIVSKPDLAQAHSNLGNALKKNGKLEEAEASYRQAIVLKPNYTDAHYNLGMLLAEHARLEEAKRSFTQAIALKPDLAKAHYSLGLCLFANNNYDLALKEFESTDAGLSKSYAIRCSYLQDKESIFYEKLDSLINRGESNAIIGSVICCSGIKYEIKRSNPFCNKPLEYVLKTDLHEQYDFEEIFIKTVRNVLADNSTFYRNQGLLTNGMQTAGNIFADKKVSETEIESIIHAEVEKYRVHFKGSDEGFVKNWPTSYKIRGWLVSMQSGGKLAAHMHEQGWLSGSIYINVPVKSEANSGNLVLRLDEQEQDCALKIHDSQERMIDVETGSLCLFPASLYHYTVPFEDKENRIVLAFDVMPIE